LLIIGIILLIYPIYMLITGYSSGFQFHIWNLQLSGTKAIIANISYSILGYEALLMQTKHRYKGCPLFRGKINSHAMNQIKLG